MPSVTEFERFYTQMGYDVHEVQLDGMGKFTIWIDRPLEAELLWHRLPTWATVETKVVFKKWDTVKTDPERSETIVEKRSWMRRLYEKCFARSTKN